MRPACHSVQASDTEASLPSMRPASSSTVTRSLRDMPFHHAMPRASSVVGMRPDVRIARFSGDGTAGEGGWHLMRIEEGIGASLEERLMEPRPQAAGLDEGSLSWRRG